MAVLAESITTKLLATAALTALVGAATDARIYPMMAPSGTGAPYLVYQEIAGAADLTLNEASASGRRLIQFSCVADTYAGVVALAKVITAALDNITLAAGEVCLSVEALDGFSEDTDQFLRIVEATFFAAPDS